MNPAALAAACNGDLANAIVASTPGDIERQEAEGQRAMVASSHLPKEMHGATRQQLEALGFVFGADVDDLFVAVSLPPGWTLRATEHSMHSDLLDASGSKRGGIFYKAAFYDRNASLSMCRRYAVEYWRPCDAAGRPCEDSESSLRVVAVYDGDSELHRIGIVLVGDRKRNDELTRQAEAWLVERFPSYTDPLAYWDEAVSA